MKVIKKILKSLLIDLYSLYFIIKNKGLPNYLIEYDGGIGDDLLCTTVAHEIHKKNGSAEIWIATKNPELFEGNKTIKAILPRGKLAISTSRFLKSKKINLAYTKSIEGKSMEEDVPPSIHILSTMCKQAGIATEIEYRTYIYLSESEKQKGRLYSRQIALQCVGPSSGTLMRNKLWHQERFQSVVNKILGLNLGIKVLQVGSLADPLLEGVEDLRGATTIRETASILSQSLCFVGTVGFLMHLANSVLCRSVIVYGGREHAWQSGYPDNFNIESLIECAPCWKWNDCEQDRQCMKDIGVDKVFSCVVELLKSRDEFSQENFNYPLLVSTP